MKMNLSKISLPKFDIKNFKIKKFEWNKKNIMMLLGIILILISVVIILTAFLDKRFYAFNGAEGYGAFADGGRHGVAYHVKTLEDSSNEGTLRYAIEQSGARTIIFDVSGIIDLKSPLIINEGALTIAGQTAPGDGICLKGNEVIVNANNVIIRYIRIRPGKTTDNVSALILNGSKNVIIDHCSISWAKGGNIILNHVKDVTLQWNYITETMGNFGIKFIGRNENVSIHHNVFANNHYSNLSFNPGYVSKNIDIRNNVFFNWDSNTISNPGRGEYNIVNNYFKYGPNTDKNNKNRILYTLESPQDSKFVYVNGNEIFLQPIISKNNIAGIYPNVEFLQTAKNKLVTKTEYNHAPVSVHSGDKLKDVVLEYAGASLRKDYPDTNVAKQVNSETVLKQNLYTNFAIYPPYKSDFTFIDSDNDGIRDDWEVQNKLNPFVAFDAVDKNKKDRMYTNRDVYLDSFVENITKKQFENVSVNDDSMQIKIYKVISNLK